MKIGDKTVVKLVYELEVEGQIADFCTEERPLEFIQGTGMLLPKFEENIAGLEPGGKFAFTLSPEEGYGVYDPERIISLPVAAFEIDGELRRDLMEVGTMLPLTDRAGNVVPGKVLEADDLFVKIDVNSPMAGKTLNFSGHIVDVREATAKELEEGLERHGCGHCGGHCGGGNCGEGGCGEGHCGEGHCGEGGCGEGHCGEGGCGEGHCGEGECRCGGE